MEYKEKNSNNKDTEYCNLIKTDKEFKMVVMKKFNKLQENSERQLNELRNKINEQKEHFTKEIEIIKKEQKNSEAEEFNK